MQSQTDQVSWRNGDVPVSLRFDDLFFNQDDGAAETAHVFLAGNDLPARFRDGFHIAELGFGTGLNLLVAWHFWKKSGVQGALHFTSFEAFPLAPDAIQRAHRSFPDFDGLRTTLTDLLTQGARTFDLPGLHAEIILGDARETLPRWDGKADAWFLDGFSPAKNPELWGERLLQEVASHTHPDGTAATYTAAGFVRRRLQAAGFSVSRADGFGRKRHMTRAKLRG
ncbi:MAG: tRNA (5-methylaminomethyl-2-thiouridine)(34)-methyltransferase MnmD [Pseudomonadota bacterium]